MTRLLILGLAMNLVGTLAAQGVLAGDLLGSGLEDFTGIPAHAVEELTDLEMDQLRGGFLGLYFTVTMAGYVEMEGVVDANLQVDVSFGEQSGSLSFETGETAESPVIENGPSGPSVSVAGTNGDQFRVQATIGESFHGAQGVFQITQVPGNLNSVGQSLTLNLYMIEASEAGGVSTPDQLASLLGF
jgi:hypothetical protein